MDILKQYSMYIGLIFLTSILSISHYKAYNYGKESGVVLQKVETDRVTNEFNDYKESIRIQRENRDKEVANERDKKRKEYDKLKDEYSSAVTDLNVELERLRESKDLPWGECVQLADTIRVRPSGVSGNTGGLLEGLKVGSRAEVSTPRFASAYEFYDASMSDAMQCYSLIEAVKKAKSNPLKKK